MHDIGSGGLQFTVYMLTTENFDNPALRLRRATKFSQVDLNLLMMDLTLLVLSHKYTDQDLFDLIHSK
jgi:hypothetical protein